MNKRLTNAAFKQQAVKDRISETGGRFGFGGYVWRSSNFLRHSRYNFTVDFDSRDARIYNYAMLWSNESGFIRLPLFMLSNVNFIP